MAEQGLPVLPLQFRHIVAPLAVARLTRQNPVVCVVQPSTVKRNYMIHRGGVERQFHITPVALVGELQQLPALRPVAPLPVILLAAVGNWRGEKSHLYSLLWRHSRPPARGSRDVGAVLLRQRVIIHQQRTSGNLEVTMAALDHLESPLRSRIEERLRDTH